MFGKAEALVEKYPVLFYFRVANKFYSQRQNIRCTQQGGSAKLKKKKKGLVLLYIAFCLALQFCLTRDRRRFSSTFIYQYANEFDT